MGSGRSLHCPVSFMFELSHQKGTLQTPSWKVPSCSTDVSQEPLQDVWRSVTEDVIACSLHVKRSKLLGNLIFLFFFFSQAYMYPCLQVYKGHMYVKISVTPLSWGSCRTQNSPILISLTRWLADLSQQLAPGIPPLFLSVLGFKHALPVGSSGSGNPDSGPDACPPSLPSPSLTLFSLEVKDFCWFVV